MRISELIQDKALSASSVKEEYRGVLDTLKGFQDPEKLLASFDRFWEDLLKRIKSGQAEFLPYPTEEEIHNAFASIDSVIPPDIMLRLNFKDPGATLVRVRMRGVDVNFTETASEKNDNVSAETYSSISPKQIVVYYCDTSDLSRYLNSSNGVKETLIHEFIHSEQGWWIGWLSDWGSGYASRSAEQQAYIVSGLSPLYKALALGRSKKQFDKSAVYFFNRETKGSFKGFAAFLDSNIFRPVPAKARCELLIEFVRSGRMKRVYSYFGNGFAKLGGFPPETESDLDRAEAEVLDHLNGVCSRL